MTTIPARVGKQPYDYQSAHKLVKHLRGPASSHPCMDCGDEAKHWAFDHQSDPVHHRMGVASHRAESLYRYSVDPWSYLSMCARCHKRFDAAVRAAG